MSYVRAKICGITREADALRAVRLGADAVGFILWPGSPRAVTPEQAGAIARTLPPFVWKVGVFVNAAPDEVERATRLAHLNVAQLHGDEDPVAYRHVHVQLVKTVPVRSADDVRRALVMPGQVMLLADAYDVEHRGGTGRLANWDLAAEIAKERPMILAGGLNAENVVDAVDRVRPWGVDVSSSVEDAPGVKNHSKLSVFFSALEPIRSVKRD